MTKILSMWHMFGKLCKSILESFQIEEAAKSLGDNHCVAGRLVYSISLVV